MSVVRSCFDSTGLSNMSLCMAVPVLSEEVLG